MRFLRHIASTLGVVAVIVAIGFLWRITPAASVVADDHDRGGPPAGFAAKTPPTGRPGFDRSFGRNDSANLTDPSDLIQTIVTVGGVIAGVVVIDAARRRRALPHRVPART